MSSEDSNKANVSPDHQLLMFYSQESLFTRRAAPCIADIEEKLGAPIFKLEAIENKYNKMLYETFNPGLKKCHGFPFFFNKDNGDYICGYFKCSFVQEWAGVPIDTSLDPKY